MKKLISKKTNHAFGKKIFLLGRDKDGINYWLEESKWECGWYWGFGYVETYTNNHKPHLSKDISSHQHLSCIMEKKGDFLVHNIFDSPILVETTFSEKDGWILSELIKSAYQLKESAELFSRGGSHITTNPCYQLIKNQDWAIKINSEILPMIFEKIYTILSPSK